jgi:hypothetical protein
LTIPDARKVLQDFNGDMFKTVGIIQIAVIGLLVFGDFLRWVSKLKNTPGKE